MSQQFQNAVDAMHEEIAKRFAQNSDGKRRHVECRIDDQIYVYLYEDGQYVQTQHVEVPEHWFDDWPSDKTVRSYVRRHADIGSATIKSLDS